MKFIHSNKKYIERTMYPINPYAHLTYIETPAILNDGNTVGWWDISKLETIVLDGNNYVSRWNDISGNSNDLVQNNQSLKPQFQNGSLYFNGSNTLRTAYFPLPQPISMYIVLDLSYPTNYIFDGYSEDSIILYNGGREPYAGRIPGRNLSREGGLIVRRLIYNGPNSKFIVGNGVGLSANDNFLRTVTGDPGSNQMNGLTLGSRSPSGYGGTFNIREFILRKVADTDTDQTAIYNYLNAKYNIL